MVCSPEQLIIEFQLLYKVSDPDFVYHSKRDRIFDAEYTGPCAATLPRHVCEKREKKRIQNSSFQVAADPPLIIPTKSRKKDFELRTRNTHAHPLQVLSHKYIWKLLYREASRKTNISVVILACERSK